MRVLYCLRQDAGTKPGGDVVQAREYADGLRRAFPEIEIRFSHDYGGGRKDWDLIHFFNLSRIQEHQWMAGEHTARKYLFSTIMQPRPLKLRAEYLKSAARMLSRGILPRGRSVESIEGALTRREDTLLFLSQAEASAFFRRYPALEGRAYHVLPNGVPGAAIGRCLTDSERDIDIVVVGRIEPGKNSARLASLLRRHFQDHRVLFVGGPNRSRPLHLVRFLAEVRRAPNITYLGKVGRTEVIEILQRSRLLVNASRAEVSPLVDLEALAAGCRVLSTRHSFTHLAESPGHFERVFPEFEGELVQGTRRLLRGESPPAGRPSPQIRSWREVAEAYTRIVVKGCEGRFVDGAPNEPL